MARRTLGELELEVLKVVGERQPCSMAEVAAVMAGRGGYARTTILTVMARLTDKGFVKRRKLGRVYRYSAARQPQAVVQGLIRQFVEKVLDGSPAPFVAYLSEAEDLTDEEVESLREIARSLERRRRQADGRVDEVAE